MDSLTDTEKGYTYIGMDTKLSKIALSAAQAERRAAENPQGTTLQEKC